MFEEVFISRMASFKNRRRSLTSQHSRSTRIWIMSGSFLVIKSGRENDIKQAVAMSMFSIAYSWQFLVGEIL